jgi:phosphoribosylformylglycinamidine synthase
VRLERVLGTFKPTGRLVLKYHGQQVADLDMKLLHEGRPPVVREAVYQHLAGTPVRAQSASEESNVRFLACALIRCGL